LKPLQFRPQSLFAPAFGVNERPEVVLAVIHQPIPLAENPGVVEIIPALDSAAFVLPLAVQIVKIIVFPYPDHRDMIAVGLTVEDAAIRPGKPICEPALQYRFIFG
jgi:hypothetical protein